MERPDLSTFACVNPACHQCRHAGQGHLVIRKVYGRDGMRLLRCRPCGEAFSERRGSALFNSKLPEAKAADGINPLDAGCRVRSTARLVPGCKETVARLLRVSGRHAERFHEAHVHDLRPLALACDEQWRCVKKSNNAAWLMNGRPQVTCGTTRLWPLTASWWGRYGWANAPMTRRWPWCKMPKAGCVRGTYRHCAPMPLRAMSRPFWRSLDVVSRKRAGALGR